MEIFDFGFEPANEINARLAKRLRNIRRRRKITQAKISELSGVSLGSVKRFEQTGEASLLAVTKLAIALGVEDEIKNLFAAVSYLTLEEIENENNLKN